MSEQAVRIAQNLAEVQERIAAAAQQAGRQSSDVTLVAVTKYVDLPEIAALRSAGCTDLGESRPQELWRKAAALVNEPIRWHLVGHLQRNELKRTLPLVSLMHSADSLRLLQEIDQAAQADNLRPRLLIEVNISGDATKYGFQPADLPAACDSIVSLPSIEVCGLMGMASREGDLAAAQAEFALLRELRDQMQQRVGTQFNLRELSMGMSGDFEVAIAEGATLVRVGSSLFAGLEDQESAAHG